MTDVHVNPNVGHREIPLRDLDGKLAVLAEPAYPGPGQIDHPAVIMVAT